MDYPTPSLVTTPTELTCPISVATNMNFIAINCRCMDVVLPSAQVQTHVLMGLAWGPKHVARVNGNKWTEGSAVGLYWYTHVQTECALWTVRSSVICFLAAPIGITGCFNPSKPSGHYTTSLSFNNSTFCPFSVFMCFVWILEQTAIISLYNIKWLVL
jgi:hypothetical protein